MSDPESLGGAATPAPRSPPAPRGVRRLAGLALPALLAGLLLAAWGPIVFRAEEPRFLGMLDHWGQSVPQAFVLDRALHEGELPLWNPLLLCGTPFAAHPGWHPFYPPHLLRGLLTPDPTPARTHAGLALLVGLHLLLAGAGAFGLARAHGLRVPGAWVAAAAFVLSAAVTQRACANHFMKSLPWLPLLLLAAHRALAAEGARAALRPALAAALVFGLLTLGGPPQIVYYAALALGLYALTEGAVGRAGVARGAGLALGAAAFGGLLASAILLPAHEFAGLSARGADSAVEVVSQSADASGLGLASLARSLVLFPGELTQGDLLEVLPLPRFAGLSVLLLALAGLFHRAARRLVPAVVLLAFFADASRGAPAPCALVLDALAPFRTDVPSRASAVAALPLALLAGFGVEALAEARGRRRALLSLALLAVGVPALAALRGLATESPAAPPDAVVLLPGGLLAAGLLAALASAPRARRATALLAALLVTLELVVWNRAFLPFLIQRSYALPAETLESRPTLWAGNERGTWTPPNAGLFELAPAINGYDPLQIAAVQEVLCAPRASGRYERKLEADEVTARNPRGLLFEKRAFSLARRAVRGPLPEKTRLFPAATTVYLPDLPEDAELPVPMIAPEDVPDSAVSAERAVVPVPIADGSVRVLGPLDTTAGGVARQASLVLGLATPERTRVRVLLEDVARGRREEGRLLRLAPGASAVEVPLPDWASVRVELVPDETRGLALQSATLLLDLADEGHLVEVLERSFDRVRVRVRDLEGPRVLLCVDAWYPGWEARLDGEPAPLLRANDAFKAVVVPAGTHEVELAFRSPRVRLGLALSGLALLVWVALFVRAGARRSPRVSPGVSLGPPPAQG